MCNATDSIRTSFTCELNDIIRTEILMKERLQKQK